MSKQATMDLDLITGYYGRPASPGSRMVVSGVHLVSGKTGRPLCGYKPVKGMQYQECARVVVLKYVACAKCKAIYNRKAAEPAERITRMTSRDIEKRMAKIKDMILAMDKDLSKDGETAWLMDIPINGIEISRGSKLSFQLGAG